MPATLLVQFGSGAEQGFALAELDDSLNLDAEGKSTSSFEPGQQIWFWVHHEAGLRISGIKVSGRQGQIAAMGTVQRTREQELAWPDIESKLTLSYLPDFMPILKWYGLPGTGLVLAGRELGISDGAPCLADATITFTAHLFCFTPPPLDLKTADEEYKLIFYINMEKA